MSASENELSENRGNINGYSNAAGHKKTPRKQTFWQRWRRMSLPNQLMFLATLVIAVATVINVAVFTAESISSSRQTDKLVGYAETQANSASDIGDAAQQFSDTAEDINVRMLEAVGQLKATADATQQQVKAAQNSVKAVQEQATIARQLAQEDRRPWVGARDFECGKCATIPKETNPYDGRTPVTAEEITWGDMSIFLENSGRTPAIDMDFSSFFGILRTKSQPIPNYDGILAELTPKTIPDQIAKQVEIVKKFTGLISTVLLPNSSRKMNMPEQGSGWRRLNIPIPEQTVTYILGRITYYGPERRKQFVTNFCLMNEKGVEFRFCPSGNDMK